MSNRHNKEDADEEYYSSQPVTKASKWTFSKWRRTSKNSGETSQNSHNVTENTPENPPENAPENQPENAPENQQENAPQNQQQKRKWVFGCEESAKWSQDAVEFYHNGDAPFCYSRYLGHMKLGSDFWGTLLGIRSNGELWPMHIEGWVTRMMRMRQALEKKTGHRGVRWKILPLQIWDDLCAEESKHSAKYVNGEDELFPRICEVDYVYIPLYITGTEDWLLVRIEMRTMELLQYWSNNMYKINYRELIHRPKLEGLRDGFLWLLDEIKYWRNYGPFITYRCSKKITFAVNDDYFPKDGGGLDGDSGVFVCMLMLKLIQDKTVVMEPNFKETLYNFRLHMAEQLYKCRFVPNLSDE